MNKHRLLPRIPLKRIAIVLLALILAFPSGVVTAYAADFAGGDGTAENPWLISTPEQLDKVREYLGSAHADKHFKLASHIDLEDYLDGASSGWEPIGNASTAFHGSFDGAGYNIINLRINRPTESFVGLFGTVNSATIENVSVTTGIGEEVIGEQSVGILSGRASSSTFINCHTGGIVTSKTKLLGGLIGDISGTSNKISYCTSSAEVSTTWQNEEDTEDRSFTGGLVGRASYTTFDTCSTGGDVTGYFGRVGGLVGHLGNSTVRTSNASGRVSGVTWDTGGLVGFCDGSTIEGCSATGEVRGGMDASGGLVGKTNNSSVISNSHASGYVDATWHKNGGPQTGRDGNYVGGLLGKTVSGDKIRTSYATGAVNGDSWVGGLVGELKTGSSIYGSYKLGNNNDVRVWGESGGGLVGINRSSSISESYSTATVNGSGDSNYIGSLIGTNNGYVENCYATANSSGRNAVSALVGYSQGGYISKSYCRGTASGNDWLGSIAGYALASSQVVDVFCRTDTGINRIGATDIPPYDISRTFQKSLDDLKRKETFTDDLEAAGRNPWDFDSIWFMDPDIGGYPNLYATVGFSGGDGSEGSPWVITSPEQLDDVRRFPDRHFVLGNSIDMTAYLSADGKNAEGYDIYDGSGPGYNAGQQWVPIGDTTTPFVGSFDGKGFSITGLAINDPSRENSGLFGVAQGATIQNVAVSGDVVGGDNGGLLVGTLGSGSRLDKCSTQGSITGNGLIGGLVGISNGSIDQCYSTATATSTGTGSGSAGGLVGSIGTGASVSDSFGSGTATASGGTVRYAGGLVGDMSGGTISNCYATGVVGAFGATATTRASFIGRALDGSVVTSANGSINWGFPSVGIDTALVSGDIQTFTVDEMTRQATFTTTPFSWDFEDIWYVSEGNHFPKLRWALSTPPAPAGDELPDGLEANVGQQLMNIGLDQWPGFRWADKTLTVSSAGENTFEVIFNPDPWKYFDIRDLSVIVTGVKQVSPAPTDTLEISTEYAPGKTLGDVSLVGNPGYSWVDSTQALGDASPSAKTFSAYYTMDPDLYAPIEVEVLVTVTKAKASVVSPSGLTGEIGDTLADVDLPPQWSWADGTAILSPRGTRSYTALYTPTAAQLTNYDFSEVDGFSSSANTVGRDLEVVVFDPTYEANKADLDAALAIIEGALYSYPQKEVNSPAELDPALEETIGDLLGHLTSPLDFTISSTSFAPATAGTEDNEPGVNGSFNFIVDVTVGEGESAASGTTQSLGGTITATSFGDLPKLSVVAVSPQVNYGEGIVLQATAQNMAPTTYAWYRSSTQGDAGTLIAETSTASLNTSAAEIGTFWYYCAAEGVESDAVQVTVDKRTITVTADDKTKYFGDVDPTLTWSVTYGSLVSGDTLNGSLTHSGFGIGTYDIVQAVPLSHPSYDVTFIAGEMTIIANPAMQEVIDRIAGLPSPVLTLKDADSVADVTGLFNGLTEAEQGQMPAEATAKLERAQSEAGAINHTSENIRAVKGLPWFIRIVVTKIDAGDPRWADIEDRVAKKDLLGLFDITLVNTLTGEPYTLPEGENVGITMSGVVPSSTDIPTIVHQKADGTIEFIAGTVDGDSITFTASDFSLYGVVVDTPETPAPPTKADGQKKLIAATKGEAPLSGDPGISSAIIGALLALFVLGVYQLYMRGRSRRNVDLK